MPANQRFEFGPDDNTTGTTRAHGRLVLTILGVVALIATAGSYLYFFEREFVRNALQGTPLEPAPKTTQVYKWKDSDGNWQLTDQPPPEGVEYEVSNYTSDTNVMPLVPREN